jgi:hypothetical protein
VCGRFFDSKEINGKQEEQYLFENTAKAVGFIEQD